MGDSKVVQLTAADIDHADQATKDMLADHRKKQSELSLEGIDVEDIKEWWSRKILNNTAYVAIALKCQALRTYRITGNMPSTLDINLESFSADWKYVDAAGKLHYLTGGEIMSAIAALQKKFEFSIQTRQLTLEL